MHDRIVPHRDDDLSGVSSGRDAPIEVRRSSRRKSTVSAHREGETIIVSIPAHFTRAQEQRWVSAMVDRLARKEQRKRPSDAGLRDRAALLSRQYLGGRAVPSSIRWVSNQARRWGSCTVSDGSIRISTRLRGVPPHVLDYVILHELTHLLHAGHGPSFWKILEVYPHTERARGFLEGLEYSHTVLGLDWEHADVDGPGEGADS